MAVPLALFFVLLEGLKGVRSASWSGYGGEQFLGLAVGGVLYFLVIALTTALLRRRRASRDAGDTAMLVGPILAAALLWGILSIHREHAPTLDDALVLGALLAIGMGGVVFKWVGAGGTREYALALTGLLGAGVILFFGLSNPLLFYADRLHLLMMILGGALAAFGVVAFILTRKTETRVWTLYAGAVLGLSALVVTGVHLLPLPARDPGPPNVVFVVADTLRAKDMSLHGGDVATPALENLASDGTTFEQAVSLAPWTMPSMQGMWTSQYPAGFSPKGTVEEWVDQSWRYCRDTGIETLAEKLKAKGYETGALIANALIWGMPDIMRGHDMRVMSHPIMLTPSGIFSAMPFLTDVLRARAPGLLEIRPHNTTRALDRFAKSWVRAHSGEPFYLYVHYIDPHAPYDPPDRYRTMTGAWPFFYPYPGGERWGIPILGPDHFVPEEHRDYVTDLYKGEVRYIDEFMGRLMGYLEDAGVAENTLVVFTSDHGEELWEHGEFGHGQSVHGEQMHVPLVLRGPGIATQRLGGWTSQIDLIPTLAGLLDMEPEDAWQGRDLSSVLRGKADLPAPPPVFAQATNNKCYPWPQQMVIDGDWKLIRENGSDERMLYNLSADPDEQNDLSAAHPKRVADLEAQLDAWLATFDSTFEPDGEPIPEGMTQEAVDQLRGMGYL
jgi:arylsulfatase A-like enzyme